VDECTSLVAGVTLRVKVVSKDAFGNIQSRTAADAFGLSVTDAAGTTMSPAVAAAVSGPAGEYGTSFTITVSGAASVVGPDRCCSPRQRMALYETRVINA